jgi:type II secretory pathway pseudopilin PulG
MCLYVFAKQLAYLMLRPHHRGASGPKNTRRRSEAEAGFTLVELAVAMGIMLIVMLVFLSLVPTSQKSSNVAEALINNEQDVSLAIARMEKDIRAANPLVAFCSYTTYQDEIELELGPASGPQQTIMWVYSPTADTLTREVVTNPGCNPAPSGSGEVTTGIVNGATTPVFAYFDDTGTALDTAQETPSNIANCTVRVAITLEEQEDGSPQPFTEQVNVWLRDRLPGGMPGC